MIDIDNPTNFSNIIEHRNDCGCGYGYDCGCECGYELTTAFPLHIAYYGFEKQHVILNT